MPGADPPARFKPRPQPLGITHQPRDSLRPLRTKARASSPHTRTGPPRQTRARTLETPRALNPPAQSPGAPRTPQRSRAEPSPERHQRTPTLLATRPEVATASAPSNAQGPARFHPAPARPSSPVPRPTPEHCQTQARNTPAQFKPRPQPLGITRTIPGTVSDLLRKNARASSPNTRQTPARTLETRRARLIPGAVARRATDPAAFKTRALTPAHHEPCEGCNHFPLISSNPLFASLCASPIWAGVIRLSRSPSLARASSCPLAAAILAHT